LLIFYLKQPEIALFWDKEFPQEKRRGSLKKLALFIRAMISEVFHVGQDNS